MNLLLSFCFIAGSNTSDAINWLESQGITMISTSDGNIITSAVESGQTITLTGILNLKVYITSKSLGVNCSTSHMKMEGVVYFNQAFCLLVCMQS